MKWCKIPHGLPFDPKLAVAARKSGLSRVEIIAVYIAILNSPVLDIETLSIQLEMTEEALKSGITALQERKLVTHDNRASCHTATRPSASTLRVRAWRAEQKRREQETRRQRKSSSADGSISHPDMPHEAATRRQRLMQTSSQPPSRSPIV